MIQREIDRHYRRGFSLIELLIVIAIIGVLFGLAAGAAFQVIGVQRTSNTETAMTTIGRTLQAHWDYVTNQAAKEEPSPAVLDLASGDRARARVIWIKLRQAEAFPQSYEEVKIAMAGGGVYAPGLIPPDRRQYMNKYWKDIQKVRDGVAYPSNTNPMAESTACLYLSLTNNRGGNKLDEANLASIVKDFDGDGIREFIDGFGRPMRFQRFLTDPANAFKKMPFSLIKYTDPGPPPLLRYRPGISVEFEVAITPPKPGDVPPAGFALAKAQDELAASNTKRGDPGDPEGTLRQTDSTQGGVFWCRTDKGKAFAAICDLWFPTAADGPTCFEKLYQINSDPDALSQPYFLPHLSSSGRDEIFFTDDDIYSFRLLRVGSRGS